MNQYKWLILALVVIGVMAAGWYWGKGAKNGLVPAAVTPPAADLNPPQPPVDYRVGPAKLKVEVRDTQDGRELGLSYRKTLGMDEGMVFVFPEPAAYAFWMKDMEFPLDMIWIRDNKVVFVTADIPAPKPGEQPVTITPQEQIDMVLEVNAGWAERNGVKVGDVVSK